jgi:hypothetical protein
MNARIGTLDFRQALEITRVSFQMEVRGKRRGAGSGGRFRGLISLWLMYVLAGAFMGISVTPSSDPFTMGLIASTAILLLVGTFVVMEFSTIVTGPADLEFYSPLPVSPRTYVTAKIAVACMFAVCFFACFGAPFALITVLRGVAPVLIAGHLFSLLISSVTATLGVITLLGMAVRFVSYGKLRNVAAFFQLILFLLIYGGYAIMQRYLRGIQDTTIALTPLLLIAPSAWGPSIFRLGNDILAAVGFALSLAVPVVLLITSIRVVSSSYAGTISEAEVFSPKIAKAKGKSKLHTHSILWRSPEERAIALLISNHFRHNSQFRMGILVIVPITLLYLGIILFVNQTSLLDPFTAAGRDSFPQTFLLYLAIGFFPSYVKSALTHSNASDTHWIFLASPADRLKLLAAARTFISIFFITPYLLALAAVYFGFTHALLHTLQHFMVITLLVIIETDVLLLFFPELPFSKPAQTGTRSVQMLTRIVSAFIAPVPVMLLVYFVYPKPLLYWIVLAALAITLVIIRATGMKFAVSRLERQELTT